MFRPYKKIEEIVKDAAEAIVSKFADDAPIASGELADSIEYKVIPQGGNFEFGIFMPEYGIYQDVGVSGYEKKYSTPFSFKKDTKMVPPSKIESWIRSVGFRPRDYATGRFMTYKQASFMISRAIKRDGIEPKRWIDRDYLEERSDELSIEVMEGIWDEFSDYFDKEQKNN